METSGSLFLFCSRTPACFWPSLEFDSPRAGHHYRQPQHPKTSLRGWRHVGPLSCAACRQQSLCRCLFVLFHCILKTETVISEQMFPFILAQWWECLKEAAVSGLNCIFYYFTFVDKVRHADWSDSGPLSHKKYAHTWEIIWCNTMKSGKHLARLSLNPSMRIEAGSHSSKRCHWLYLFLGHTVFINFVYLSCVRARKTFLLH